MEKNFVSVEDVLADESFLSWYYHESDEKLQEWNEWQAKNPHQNSLIDEAVNLMSRLPVKENDIPSARLESALQRLNTGLDSINKNEAPVFQINRAGKWRWIAAAAAVVIFFAGITIWKYAGDNRSTIKASFGELSQNRLPDGSEVILNANSTVTLGDKWEEGVDREVWLKGEAFFHVKKTSDHNRFIVHTDKMDVIVTGTQFNVITRDEKSSVLLTEGSVTIRTREGKEIRMQPGDFVEINNDQIEKKPANEEAILAWRNNQLLFEHTAMADVARIISEHYGVKVVLADEEVRNETLSGIMANNNLDVLLKSLETAKNFKITRNDSTIIIAKP